MFWVGPRSYQLCDISTCSITFYLVTITGSALRMVWDDGQYETVNLHLLHVVCWICFLLIVSTLEVVSSKLYLEGSVIKVRAMEITCFWPAEKIVLLIIIGSIILARRSFQCSHEYERLKQLLSTISWLAFLAHQSGILNLDRLPLNKQDRVLALIRPYPQIVQIVVTNALPSKLNATCIHIVERLMRSMMVVFPEPVWTDNR